MRYSLAVAALVAGVVAVPYEKRELVTDIDVVYETQYVTVTAGQEPSTTASATATTKAHWGHRPHKWTKTEVNIPTTYSTPEPVTTYEAPAPEVTEAPVPEIPTTYPVPAVSIPVSLPSGGIPTDYAGKVVLHHNLHRANHSAPALVWDDGLASTAAKIAASCVYAHNVDMDNGGYGQNIAAGVQGDNIASVISDLFYNGEVDYFNGLYGQASPDMSNFENWGHFSQIVWKGTSSVGCATQDCSASGLRKGDGSSMGGISPYFTVCNYKSPGNYAGQYADNIGESLHQATVGANYGS